MDHVKLHDKTFKPFIPYEKIISAIDKVADKINQDFHGCTDIPIVLCVLNGSIVFTGELLKRLNFPCQLVSMKLTSYEGTFSTGKVRQVMGLTSSVRDRRVIVVEDIVDTGRTLSHLFKILNERKPASVRLCTLLDKPERRVVDDVHVNYTGFQVEDEFVVGYGLDYDQRYRNLPYIGVIHFDD